MAQNNIRSNIKGIGSGSKDLSVYLKDFSVDSVDMPVYIRHSLPGYDSVFATISGFQEPQPVLFSLDIDEYGFSNASIYVDIYDLNWPIDPSKTYFLVDGVQVSGTVTPITISGTHSAYRLEYNPSDDFSTLQGPTQFRAHAENSIGGVGERDYYLTLGYKVDFENADHKYLDYGFSNKVVVRSTAENEATCTKESAYAYWFETRLRLHEDLSSSIVGMNNVGNLSARIVPLTTAYYYGRECRLVVKVRDFAGNRMEDFVLEFTIEDS